MIVSIHQPNYLPWMGLIHKIIESDVFVVLDDVQFVRGKNFVTRSQIKTSGGPKWISIPVHNKNDFLPINQIKINNDIPWKDEHWNKIIQNYNKAKFFSDYDILLKNSIYQKWENISEMNTALIQQILKILKIETRIQFSSELNTRGVGLEKIVSIIKEVNGDEYLSGEGIGSLRYIQGNEKVFEENKIKLAFQKFVHPVYFQLHGEFIPKLSILDAIFNIGPKDTLKKLNQI
mgnify:FL=1|jgi:hypothetical protein